MKLNIKSLPIEKLKNILELIKRYSKLAVILAFLMLYSFVVLRINILNRREPSESAVTDKLQSVQRPKIDKSLLSKIQALQDQNVQVQALFKQARDNPFSE